MSWITPANLTAVFPKLKTEEPGDLQALIDHVQGLAEGIIGGQTEPVTLVLSSTMTQITIRFWRAGEASSANPAGFQSESVEDYSYSVPTGAHLEAGLGLTNREKKQLRTAVGRTGLWVQPTTRGPVETAPIQETDQSEWLDGALGE